MEQELKETESLSIERGMSGKTSFKIKLLGRPEDNLERLKKLKKDCEDVIDKDLSE